jgi:hypothetical protein
LNRQDAPGQVIGKPNRRLDRRFPLTAQRLPADTRHFPKQEIACGLV